GYARQHGADLCRELGRDALVGIETEYPGLGGRLERHLLLRPIPGPRVVDDWRGVLPRDRDGRVARSAVHHHDLVAPGDAVEARSDLRRLVLAHDRARHADRSAWRGGTARGAAAVLARRRRCDRRPPGAAPGGG